MVDNKPIEPTHIVRFNWLYLLIVIPILANIPVQFPQEIRETGIELSVSYYSEPPFLPELQDVTNISVISDTEITRNSGNTSNEALMKAGPGSSASNADQTRDPFMPIILAAANQYKVDPAIIRAIIMAESGYNPKAVSRKGAKGLMQLMPTTARALGVKDSFNPEQNIHGGVKYFRQLLNKFNGDPSLALAAYNAGSRKVRKYKGVPPFKTTKRYIRKVFKYQKRYQQEMVESG